MNKNLSFTAEPKPEFSEMLSNLGKQIADIMEHPDCPDHVGEALANAVDGIVQEGNLQVPMFARYMFAPLVMGQITTVNELIH